MLRVDEKMLQRELWLLMTCCTLRIAKPGRLAVAGRSFCTAALDRVILLSRRGDDAATVTILNGNVQHSIIEPNSEEWTEIRIGRAGLFPLRQHPAHRMGFVLDVLSRSKPD